MTPNFLQEDMANKPFTSYDEYIQSLFYGVDMLLTTYIEDLIGTFTTRDGSIKNVLYPDIEIAYNLCNKRMWEYTKGVTSVSEDTSIEEDTPMSEEMLDIFSDFSETVSTVEHTSDTSSQEPQLTIDEIFRIIDARADLTDLKKVPMPLYYLVKTLKLSTFSVFALTCAILASTQTNYGSLYQVINQNGSLSAPSLEACGRVFYGNDFSISTCYGNMSAALNELKALLPMQVNPSLPFTTVLTLDKRFIDYLFGSTSNQMDAKFDRFCSNLISDEELPPFLANQSKLDGLKIAFDDGTKVFTMYGDEGSGRRFTIKHFCKERELGCVSINGGKLFNYDFSFVESALWTISRECIFTNACVAIDNLDYREDEKDKFFGYMDLALSLLSKHAPAIFTLSEFKLPLREFTSLEFANFELITPTVGEREVIWKYYAEGYEFADEVDLVDISTKFLFTAGKIKNSLKMGQSLSKINKEPVITNKWLFEACYSQMKHELTQKATKVTSVYTWDDIIMPPDQRQSLEYACHQMRFRKQVYEKWDYNSKYPYGRGLSVLLFGHPGTGKTMCAQVLANALNLELYRVDLSKVIDKYVGETEKSISMIFREAKKCNVVLFFDECDTLFGKRTDSGGSGESANNNKTAHLLQEIEAYDGVSVLATNFKHNIDPAFFRRMKFIVEFAFPDVETRYNIWKATIPKKTPLNEDIDLQFLAEKFEFVGGNIKNCILNAGFFAAADPPGEEMNMKHLLMAIKYELVKTGKVFTRSDFEPYADLVMQATS